MKDRTYKIALNPKYDVYQGGLASTVYRVFNKKTSSGAIATSKTEANVNVVLAQDLHKPMIKKFKRRKVHLRIKDDIWAAAFAEKGSLSSKNRGIKNLLCAINVFTKHALVKPLTDEKAKPLLNDFIGIVN